jgi:hypothetical protein
MSQANGAAVVAANSTAKLAGLSGKDLQRSSPRLEKPRPTLDDLS